MNHETAAGPSKFLHSTLRERIVEHCFIGDALRLLWQKSITDVEVLRPEFDVGGYDLVMSCRGVVRYIQLKTMSNRGKTSAIKASLKLMEKPSGCIVWIKVDEGLHHHSFLWFGGNPGEPLPSIQHMKTAKHAKGNAAGKKNERPNHRIIPRRVFEKFAKLDDILEKLFGKLS